MKRAMGYALALLLTWGCGGMEEPPAAAPAALPDMMCSGAMVGAPGTGVGSIAVGLSLLPQGQGLDLDGDGRPDNGAGVLGSLVNGSLAALVRNHELAYAIEGFGTPATPCAALAVYAVQLVIDRDHDGGTATDCDDGDPSIHAGATELPGNRIDDDCDGLADNPWPGRAGVDNQDLDGDGVTLAEGDCDDRAVSPPVGDMRTPIATLRHPAVPARGILAAAERCDGIDYNCDGIPDNSPDCDPLRSAIPVQAARAVAQGIASDKAGAIGVFPLSVPLLGGHVGLDLQRAALAAPGGSSGGVSWATIGGAVSAVTLAAARVEVPGLVAKGQSWLDAMVSDSARVVLGLRADQAGWVSLDVDVDGDGLEAYRSAGAPAIVTECRDGDGTIVRSGDPALGAEGPSCLFAKDAHGAYRFRDGLSVGLNLRAQPARLTLQ